MIPFTSKLNNAGKFLIMLLSVVSAVSCNDFLDEIPDNVSTIDHAFNLRNEAEKYLFTCYAYLPQDGDAAYNVGMLAGDEVWIPYQKGYTSYAFEIARGNQRTSDTYVNAWDGYWQGGGPGDRYPLFDGIRHCNTFLENVSDKEKILDLADEERKRWLGEAEFLKAYFHFCLLRLYGPIPLTDENLPVDAPEDEVNAERMPVDSCINYIVNLLDSAVTRLPDVISDPITEMGRITRPVALAIKARVLLYAASPLFNGNTDYSAFTNKAGEPFFNQNSDAGKWSRAADAALDAIEAAVAAGCSLYEFDNRTFSLSDTTMTQMSIRQAVCERWNSEIIWGNPNSTTSTLQQLCMVPLSADDNHNYAQKIMSPPLKIARMFYSKNGVPTDEDKTLDFSDETILRTATAEERFYIQEGYVTARINFDREPRFYASLAFDGAIWYKYDSPSNSDEGTYVVKAKYGDYAGSSHSMNYNETGYYIKKLVDWNMTMSTSGASYKRYPWPEVRLADVYLMYAEALNEASGPVSDVLYYLDKLRERAGLKGVAESWSNYSTHPNKYQTQDGLREIIHHERLIEMAFEGSRFWDLRRWKEAAEYLNQPVTGWNVYGTDAESYYQVRTVYQQEFVAPRDYLWPLVSNELLRNPKLTQTLGW